MLTDGRIDAEEESASKSELSALARRVRSLFLVPPNVGQLFASLTEAMSRIGQPYEEVARVLRANIEGLVAAVSIPFALGNQSTLDRHWQRIYSAARIRSLPLGQPNESL